MYLEDDKFYVSIKGVILHAQKVLMLCKPTGTWDLPGGRMGANESPKRSLMREVHEETGLTVRPGKLLHRWVRRRPGKGDVFLVSHFCILTDPWPEIILSHEHDSMGWFTMQEYEAMPLSPGVKKSVRRAFRHQEMD